MNKVFALSHFHYEESTTIHFLGPDNVSKQQFQELCYSLVEQAAINAVAKERKQEYPCSVGWTDVVESMIPLLEQQGYHRLKCDEVIFRGGLINRADPAHQNSEDYRLSTRAFTTILNFNRELIKEYK